MRISGKFINAIIQYIIGHPDIAQALREALLSGEEAAQSYPHLFHKNSKREWASASQVGKMIGASSAWVRQNRRIWPSARYEARGQKGKWWFDRAEVIPCYDIYIRSKSL